MKLHYYSGVLSALIFTVTISNLSAATKTLAPHSISLGGGGVYPHSQLDTGPLGGGEQTIGESGAIIGFQYLYATNPRIDIGFGIDHWKLGTKEFTVEPRTGEMKMRSTMLMAIAKMHPVRGNTFIPYFLAGAGIHFSQFDFDLRPAPGFIWVPGGTTETRSVISDKKTGLALSFGIGMDADITKSIFLSIEGRIDMTSRNTYEATTYGQSIGIESADVGAGNTVLMFRAGWRFGKSPVEVAPTPTTPQETVPPAKMEGAL